MDIISDEYAKSITIGLLNCSLPIEKWRHAEHCIATLYLIREHKELNLIKELPKIIKKYNRATGGVNNETSGYHHTITMFYLSEIEKFSYKYQNLASNLTCEKMLKSDIGDKNYPFKYWKKETLFAPSARLGFIKPDLEAIIWHDGFNLDEL